MPSLVISDGNNSRSLNVTDVAHAVRTMATEMRKFSSDSSVLAALQKWADAQFQHKLRLKYKGDWITFEYRN